MRTVNTRSDETQSGPPAYSVADLGLLNLPNEPCFQDIALLTKATLGADVVLFTVPDDARERQFFKAHVGLHGPLADSSESSIAHSICRHLRDRKAELQVPDLRSDPALRHNPVINALDVVAYAGTPVFGPDDEAVGVLCCLNRTPRIWSRGEIEILRRFGRMASALVLLRACEATLRLVAMERG